MNKKKKIPTAPDGGIIEVPADTVAQFNAGRDAGLSLAEQVERIAYDTFKKIKPDMLASLIDILRSGANKRTLNRLDKMLAKDDTNLTSQMARNVLAHLWKHPELWNEKPIHYPTCEVCEKQLSPAQIHASMQETGRALCDEHRVAAQTS